MFRSYKNNRQAPHEIGITVYRLIDDDFIQDIHILHSSMIGSTDILAIIKVYEERGLPVVSNVMKALQYLPSVFGTSMSTIVARLQKHSEYNRYKEEVNKYMLLL